MIECNPIRATLPLRTELSQAHQNEIKKVMETPCCRSARSDCGPTERLCSNRAEPVFRRKMGGWE